jgi:hypothetical protein
MDRLASSGGGGGAGCQRLGRAVAFASLLLDKVRLRCAPTVSI